MKLFSNFVVNAQIQDWDTATAGTSSCIVDGVPTLQCLEIVFGNILFAASALIILVLFIMLIIGGFYYLTSFGDPEKIKKAQGTLKFAIIGFILFLCSYLILSIIDVLFLGGGGNIFKLDLGGTP